jgi:hypothetical protein
MDCRVKPGNDEKDALVPGAMQRAALRRTGTHPAGLSDVFAQRGAAVSAGGDGAKGGGRVSGRC